MSSRKGFRVYPNASFGSAGSSIMTINIEDFIEPSLWVDNTATASIVGTVSYGPSENGPHISNTTVTLATAGVNYFKQITATVNSLRFVFSATRTVSAGSFNIYVTAKEFHNK